MPETPTTATRRAEIALWALAVALVAFCYGWTPLGDENDVWWHLKTGKVLTERDDLVPGYEGLLPERDVFAYTSADMEWHNHEWLTQWAMYGVYRAFEDRAPGGMRAVITAKALVLVATFLLVFFVAARKSGDPALAALAVALAVSCARFSVKPRPPVMTYLFMALFLWILYRANEGRDAPRARRAWLAAPPVLTVLWVNLHGGFVIGMVLIFFFGVGAAVEGVGRWLKEGRAFALWRSPEATRFVEFAVCGFVCLFASLINPYGYKLYGMYSRVMSDARLVGAIAELRPPDLYVTQAFVWMILGFVAAGALSRRRLPLVADVFILLFFLYQGIHHVRHLPLFAIAAAPILAFQIAAIREPEAGPGVERLWRAGARAVALLVIPGLLFAPRVGWGSAEKRRNLFVLERNAALWDGRAYDPQGYPEEVCNYLLAHDHPGRLFNEINFAGYLIWHLSPEKYKVFSDSRFDIFGGQFQRMADIVRNGVETESGEKLWRQLLDEWDVNIVVIDKYKRLNQRLADSGRWRLAFVDRRGYFRVWIRNEPRDVR